MPRMGSNHRPGLLSRLRARINCLCKADPRDDEWTEEEEIFNESDQSRNIKSAKISDIYSTSSRSSSFTPPQFGRLRIALQQVEQFPAKDLGPRPSIAIIGGGIVGLTLAVGLMGCGITPIVYERHKSLTTLGAGIGLGSNSLAALKLIDRRLRTLYDFAKTGNESEVYRNVVFDLLYAEPSLGGQRHPPWTGGLINAPYFERSSAYRKDLINILASCLPSSVLHFDKSCQALRQDGTSVEVIFKDGEVARFDAVFGCDGINGTARKAVLGDIKPELVAPEYSHFYAYRGILPMADARAVLQNHAADSKCFAGNGCGLITYPLARGNDVDLLFYVHHQEPWAGTPRAIRCTRQQMENDFKGCDPRLIQLLEWVQPIRWPLFHHPNTPTYYKNQICLVGDAAHASTPFLAAGAGQGLEDAALLSNMMSMVIKPEQFSAVFAAYDAVRRPRATSVIKLSYDAGLLFSCQGAEGEDMAAIMTRANDMFHLVWEQNLQADLDLAKALLLSKFIKN